MILSNKALLPFLWQLYPDHEYLLASYFEPFKLKNFVRKPIFSREGANINVFIDNNEELFTEGNYGQEGYIYQDLCVLPYFNGNYPVIGSWVIGQESAGIGIRESTSIITDNNSRFIPHLID
jgi:glutathionylspermidine synthase